MQIVPRPLPEFCYSPKPLTEVSAVVIHYFSAINVAPDRAFNPDTCYDLFVDLNHPGAERGLVMPPSDEPRAYASAHYMIDRNGVIYSLVPENRQAYHAGVSTWRGRDMLNGWSLGVELLATATSGYTDEQYAALSHLCADIMTRHNVPPDSIVGHSDVAPGRKRDPGLLFDWGRLRATLAHVIP
jgi:N-acetyl-anhydromuramyl-L-alanine amidase AmpD